jgi:ATP-dependent RNA helicase SUPV3L1/SUV3
MVGEPVPAEAAVISVSEAPTLAVSEQVEGAAGREHLLTASKPPDAESTVELAAATDFIDVWRPGRRDEHARRPRGERGSRQRRAQRQPAEGPPVATASGETAGLGADAAAKPTDAATASATAPRQARRQRPAPPDRADRPDRQPRPDRSPRHPRNERFDRPQRGDRLPHGERPEHAAHGGRPDRDPALRAKYIKGRGDGRDRRDREPDPNSPFAKLAALKEQLEANAKEPR